jgi:hypothetical protein
VAYDTLKEKYIHDTVNHADRECIFAIQARYCWELSTNSVENIWTGSREFCWRYNRRRLCLCLELSSLAVIGFRAVTRCNTASNFSWCSIESSVKVRSSMKFAIPLNFTSKLKPNGVNISVWRHLIVHSGKFVTANEFHLIAKPREKFVRCEGVNHFV